MAAVPQPLPEPKANAILKAGVAEFAARPYADASTDRITASCGISKGLLFHYFGTKKKLYLRCVQHALDTLTQAAAPLPEGGFYETLFAGMEAKMQLCLEHPAETGLLNLASRESAREVKAEKDALLSRYAGHIRARSEGVIRSAAAALPLKDAQLAVRGLTVYINALINGMLLRYQDKPEAFFLRKESIAGELRSYIDLMLYGVCKEEP